MQKNILSIIAYCLIFSIAIAIYISINSKYPYYFIWDMDQTTIVDLLLIQSKLLPVHINHTGYGMYFILSFYHAIAHALHSVSLFNLDDVKNSIQPILGIAEMTDMMRYVSPWIAGLTALALWASIAIWAEVTWIRFLILSIFLTQSSFIYHVTMIRSELYSVFFWSLAVLGISFAAKFEAFKAKQAALVISMIFAGISYLTKLQGLFYLLSLPVLYFFVESFNKKFTIENLISDEQAKKLSIINLFLCIFLMIGAAVRHADGMTFADHYPLNIIGVFYILVAVILVIIQKSSLLHKYQSYINALHLLFLGFNLSFYTHFFLYLNPRTSYKYMLLDAKMLFYRNNYYGNYSIFTVFYYSALNMLETIKQVSTAFCVNIIFAAAVIYYSSKKIERFCVAILVVLELANLGLGARGVLRDIIWAEILLNGLTAFFLYKVLIEFSSKQKKYLFAVAAIFLITSNIKASILMPKKVDANYNHYGWQQSKSFEAIYPYKQMKFAVLMDDKYGPYNGLARKRAILFAKNYGEHLRAAQFAFPNVRISSKNIGFMQENEPVDAKGMWRLGKVPKEFTGAILVEVLGEPNSNLSFDLGAIRADSESWGKIINTVSGKITVLTKNDYDIYLFLPINVAKTVGEENPNLSLHPKINISDGLKQVELQGLLIDNCREFEKNKFDGIGFFALIRKPLAN